jgi:hypothetical protein
MIEDQNLEKIKEFLASLDSNSQPINEMEISGKVKKFAEEKYGKNIPEELVAEQMAFDFIENYSDEKTGWGIYFGPMFVLPNEEGKFVEYPSIRRITPEIIAYWEKRVKEAKHPVLKARYANLVWDFSEKITGNKPHYTIAQMIIGSIIEIAENNLHKYPTDVIKKLERALSLALSINDVELIEKLKNGIINYENKIAEDDKAGLWGFSYELLVKNKKVSIGPDEEKKIIDALKQRFDRTLKKDNIFSVEHAALLLTDYYNRIGNKDKLKKTLIKFGSIVQEKAEQVSALPGMAWLERLYSIYLQYGLMEEADKVSIKLRELGEKANSELKKIEASIKIPKKEIEEFINKLIDGNLNTALAKVAIYYIPQKEKIIKQLRDLSRKAPISFLCTRKIQDHSGRVVASVGSLEEDLDGNIIHQISQNMSFNSFFLQNTIKALIHKFNLDSETIVNCLFESPIFEEKKKGFFVDGIKAYLDENFIVALHILIPQIEALIRNLVEKTGGAVLKQSRSGGFYYKTLEELLRSENVINALGEDMTFYFRVLFTDPRGWNLRNDICHGISAMETFNKMTTDRVFHSLLCLSIGKKRKGEE